MKLSIDDSPFEMIIKLAEGNPGAATALGLLATESLKIDPLVESIIYFCWLDELNLAAPDIWVLFKDVCQSQLVNVLTLLRGVQLGHVNKRDILSAVRTARPGPQTPEFAFPEIIAKIQKDCPWFAKT